MLQLVESLRSHPPNDRKHVALKALKVQRQHSAQMPLKDKERLLKQD